MALLTRQRAPLLDPATYAVLRRRGEELLGLLLLAIAGAFGTALATASLDDAGWFVATAEPVSNWLGTLGAGFANPLILFTGWAAWLIPVAIGVWGIRFLTHKGETRILGRSPFIPVALIVGAIFLSSNVPHQAWDHGFGLGGLVGDAALRFLFSFDWLPPDQELLVTTSGFGVLALGLTFIALGFNRGELIYLGRLLLFAFGVCFASLGRLIRRRGTRRSEATADRPVFREPPLTRRSRRVAPIERTDGPEEPVTVSGHRRNWRAFGLGGLFGRSRGVAADPADPPLTAPVDIDPVLSADRAMQPGAHGDGGSEGTAARGVPDDTASESDGEPPLVSRPEDIAEFDLGPVPVGPHSPKRSETPSVVLARKPGAPRSSARARAEAQPSLFADPPIGGYTPPPLGLLANPVSIVRHHLSNEALEENARMLENVLDDYGVKGEITSVRPGPVVTMYELEPAPGLKASRVIGLADDIARSMSALSARVSTVPGRSVIGIELPNLHREKVLLNEILSSKSFGDGGFLLPLALGKDIAGTPVIADLSRMPHLLIAGTTGSGKSVAINTMILSLLYKLRPEECRLIMIDPKMLELSVYDDIPHLLSPVVTDPKKAVVALKWVVSEMEDRYRKMSWVGVRNIHGYNARVEEARESGEALTRSVQTGFDPETGAPVVETQTLDTEKLPFIVVVVDEMADLMMVAGKEIEACIQRLAQMARASGIHLIMATQRPSVDVITGTIKANFPTRISFQVTSKIDSRTIIGEMGAEQLLGMGDMLFMAGGGKITRIHSPFVSDGEVESIVNHLKVFGPPEYVSGVLEGPDEDRESEIDQILGLGSGSGDDALYGQAVMIVARDRKCSTSYIQRKLAIGYNKAARLVEQMESEGLVSRADHVGKREILMPES
ncbi:MAG: DNA translocase FtsK [Paracoccaceae bacterium]|nr:DNA translocase FtsK [Paracoccaceae bacterium]